MQSFTMTAQTLPLRRTPLQTLWYWLFRLLGWNGEYHHPSTEKFIIIVAPHTSNFDFFIGFIFSRAYAIPFPNFLAKDSAFRGWIGKLGKKVGGIPVNRSERTNFVDQVAAEFQKRDRMILAITPEGTRSYTEYWKIRFLPHGDEGKRAGDHGLHRLCAQVHCLRRCGGDHRRHGRRHRQDSRLFRQRHPAPP
jgi:1-acyl-sn-glycerol-3-phosphate acyltransferase